MSGLRETSDVVGMMRRMIRALGRRAADGDLDALAAFADLGRLITTTQGEAARAARVRHNFSWTEIGDALGTTRQNARQRFGEVDRYAPGDLDALLDAVARDAESIASPPDL